MTLLEQAEPRNSYQYVAEANILLNELGVFKSTTGTWAFTDMKTASSCYIHHSRVPVAVAAYTAIDPIFAAGRIPNYALVDLIIKIPCMDAAECTALAIICGAEPPLFPSAAQRGEIFGDTAWKIVNDYGLESCFTHVRPYGDEGRHYTMRPQGFDYDHDEPIPELLEAMRKAYRSMRPVQQIMVLTLLHLYSGERDKTFLIGGCPTKISAIKALKTLRQDGEALKIWAHLVSHYAGW
ncbi:hypothetical protein PMI38_00907 [Pseudomonas sp. GM84]|uniref:hypothetical protein n=1 Tax=Pseudomonas sp. GM84 TaxID=1144340 RepID=UPI00026F55CF|nr:hypothetical protein [Pseudomonas sp. GM84]EJN39675.1 hypothetical protein PMI38_00907 [Pseudomonas sp. GM84]